MNRDQQAYRNVYEAAPLAFVLWDTQCRITDWNKHAEMMFGWSRQELLGRNFFEVLIPTHARPPVEKIVASLSQGKVRSRTINENLTKSGEMILCEWNNTIRYDDEGQIVGAMSLGLDIAERGRAEEALIKSEKALRFLSAELLSAQEKERARISRELHDGVGQSLGTLKMRVERLVQLARASGAGVDLQELSSLVPIIQQTMEEVRNTSMGLRPSTLDTLGILATLTWFCRDFQTTCPSIRIEKRIDIQEGDVPAPLKTVLYRILQEAFNNVAKHGKASWVRLTLVSAQGQITLTVEDNGKGFDFPRLTDRPAGLGLTSMRERAELSGGCFNIESEPGKGTRLQACWPVQT